MSFGREVLAGKFSLPYGCCGSTLWEHAMGASDYSNTLGCSSSPGYDEAKLPLLVTLAVLFCCFSLDEFLIFMIGLGNFQSSL